jgi:hypothetical protein
MNEFWTNVFLSESVNFIYLLIALVLIFHFLLVWPRNLSKKNWKYVDYIWLGIATFGLLGAAANIRIAVASNWVQLEKSRAIGILESIDFLARDAESSNFCRKFSKTEYSPKNLDEIQLQYDLACEWRKQLSSYLRLIDKQEIPAISFSDFPEVKFDMPELNKTVVWLKESLEDYSKQRISLEETKLAASYTQREEGFAYFAPFLLCMALALRIAKVSGEIRHET